MFEIFASCVSVVKVSHCKIKRTFSIKSLKIKIHDALRNCLNGSW